ncbi:hypothetical protein [Nostoc sp. 'Peltigera membranacea cyanobiont' 232]|uniref:hypothetical protein n=1 Tax=Nostoc sp. 'Peltigera membranacea cyanobiont' 232 TaxID=2014531 RepID=UPI001CB89BCD|nr:hypothetical protein [Nostoc sp. 'Peltigera membranacea cyanobiont' 232]
MLVTAVAIQAISLLLFMKVIVLGKYYRKVSWLKYLTYAQATEKSTTQNAEDMDKCELETVLA